jgi:NAD(P)-dependent dehydrogenase (short-subunit alcohol dehydrogenase family)
MDLDLRGKRALVTGASRGIGFATAKLLVSHGAAVSICARGAAGLDQAVAELSRSGTAIGATLDVGDRDALVSWVNAANEQLGGLDIVIANASALAEGTTEDDWRNSFEVDLMHSVHMAEASLPMLIETHGSIVLVSSASAVMTDHEETAYGALKAALVSYGAQLAQAVGKHGVRVNSVLPGAIHFPGGVWDKVKQEDPQTFGSVRDMHVLGRMGTAEEVANATVFLASPAASFITGVGLRVDGGLLKTVQL